MKYESTKKAVEKYQQQRKRLSVWLLPSQHEAVQKAASDAGLSVSAFVVETLAARIISEYKGDN